MSEMAWDVLKYVIGLCVPVATSLLAFIWHTISKLRQDLRTLEKEHDGRFAGHDKRIATLEDRLKDAVQQLSEVSNSTSRIAEMLTRLDERNKHQVEWNGTFAANMERLTNAVHSVMRKCAAAGHMKPEDVANL